MKRSNILLKKRKAFVDDYFKVQTHEGKNISEIVIALSERLFISERTVYNIMSEKGNYGNLK